LVWCEPKGPGDVRFVSVEPVVRFGGGNGNKKKGKKSSSDHGGEKRGTVVLRLEDDNGKGERVPKFRPNAEERGHQEENKGTKLWGPKSSSNSKKMGKHRLMNCPNCGNLAGEREVLREYLHWPGTFCCRRYARSVGNEKSKTLLVFASGGEAR